MLYIPLGFYSRKAFSEILFYTTPLIIFLIYCKFMTIYLVKVFSVTVHFDWKARRHLVYMYTLSLWLWGKSRWPFLIKSMWHLLTQNRKNVQHNSIFNHDSFLYSNRCDNKLNLFLRHRKNVPYLFICIYQLTDK